MKTKEKLWILATGFAAFAGGVMALQLERGAARSAVLTVCFAVLIALAVRQTLVRMKKSGK